MSETPSWAVFLDCSRTTLFVMIPITDDKSTACERKAGISYRWGKNLVERDTERRDVLICSVVAAVLRPCLPAQP